MEIKNIIVKIGWFKMKPEAIIPTKTQNNAGFDIYTVENNVVIKPHSQYMFSTGLGVCVSKGWWLKADDRGSTGSKGIHIHCGIIDNNYRGELFICLKNDNPYKIIFTNDKKPGFHRTWYGRKYLVYPVSKAIAQLVLIPQPDTRSYEMSAEEWDAVKNTDRGEGKLGSSGK